MDTQTPAPESGRYTAGEIRTAVRLIPTAFAFAAAFQALTTGAVFTSFLVKFLHADDFWYGVILAATQAAVFLQFVGSLIIERLGRVKPRYVFLSIPQRLFWLTMAAVPLLLPRIPEDARLHLVLAMVLLASAFQHLGGGGLMAWFAQIVPATFMGRFFGQRQRAGMISMLIVAVVAALALDRFPDQGWVYAVLFAAAALFGLVDLALTHRIPERPRPPDSTSTLAEIIATPWRDGFSRVYVIYALLAGIVTASLDPFVLKYGFAAPAEGGLGLNVSVGNLLLFILPILVMAWAAPHWGHVVDRHGPKPVLTTCMIGLIALPWGWVLMRPGLCWLIPVLTGFTALCNSGALQVETFMRSKGFPEHRRTSFLALLNVMLGLAGVAGTLLGGMAATFWKGHLPALAWLPGWMSHYHLLFVTAILLRMLLFFGVMIWLPLPGAADRGGVLRHLARSGLGR